MWPGSSTWCVLPPYRCTDPSVSNACAGDPYGPHEVRYSDGNAWTEHVADGGITATDEPR